MISKTVLGAEINTSAAMNADEDLAPGIGINGINGAGGDTGTTADTQLFSDDDSTTLSLAEGRSRAGGDTGSRITGQTAHGQETAGKAAT